MVSMLEKGETINEFVPQHGASPDLPTAHASNLPTPSNVSNVVDPTSSVLCVC